MHAGLALYYYFCQGYCKGFRLCMSGNFQSTLGFHMIEKLIISTDVLWIFQPCIMKTQSSFPVLWFVRLPKRHVLFLLLWYECFWLLTDLRSQYRKVDIFIAYGIQIAINLDYDTKYWFKHHIYQYDVFKINLVIEESIASCTTWI